MKKNHRVEICSLKDGKWIRLTAEAVLDSRAEARGAMLTQSPDLRGMYKEDDGIFEVLYMKNAAAAIASFTDERDQEADHDRPCPACERTVLQREQLRAGGFLCFCRCYRL